MELRGDENMRFYEMDLDEEGKELRINSFKEDVREKYKEYEHNFYSEKIKKLKEGFEELSISDNANNAIRGVYRDLIFLESVSEEKLKKFCEVNDANNFNQKAGKDYDENNTIKNFKNHTLDYFIKKIYSKLILLIKYLKDLWIIFKMDIMKIMMQ